MLWMSPYVLDGRGTRGLLINRFRIQILSRSPKYRGSVLETPTHDDKRTLSNEKARFALQASFNENHSAPSGSRSPLSSGHRSRQAFLDTGSPRRVVADLTRSEARDKPPLIQMFSLTR